MVNDTATGSIAVPSNGNISSKVADWTPEEISKVSEAAKMWARWEVSFSPSYIRSPACEGKTASLDSICDECRLIENDPALKQAIRRVCTIPLHIFFLTLT